MQTEMWASLGRLGLILAFISPVYGQDKQDKEEETKADFIEEIIVTAEKREENIMDVPLTVTAFTDGMIEELGMTNSRDLENLVPGLQIGDNIENIGHGIVIRGIGTKGSGETHRDLAVATYVDGVYSHTTSGIAPNLFDVERLEVGRGPQGTLNGRNSIAGSISYVTKKPSSEWDVNVLTEFTDQFTQRYNLAFGGPITEHLSFRVTGGYYEGDGAQKNRGLGGDYDAPDETTYAPQLRLDTDRVDINVRFARTEDTGVGRTDVLLFQPNRNQPFECYWLEQEGNRAANAFNHIQEGDFPGVINGQPFDCSGTVDKPTNIFYLAKDNNPAVEDCHPTELANQCKDLKNEIAVNRPGGGRSLRDSWTMNASFDVTDTLIVRYTGGISGVLQDSWKDSDYSNRVGSAADPLLSSDGGTHFADIRHYAPYENDNKSHELQLFSNYDGPFNFILGAYYYENRTYWETSQTNFGWQGWSVTAADNERRAQAQGYASCEAALTANPGWYIYEGYGTRCIPEGYMITNDFNTEAESSTEAIFASADYVINERWLVSGGLRYTEDTKGREQDFFWEAVTLHDIASTYEDDTDDLLIIWDATTKPIEQESDQNPTWDKVIWNISLEHRPDENTMYYGRISTGYRAGGFNSASGFNPPIEEETLINYELGVKGLFLDQRLNIRAAAFFEDYDNYQHTATTFHPNPLPNRESPLVEFTDNIDGTTIYGLEVEYSYNFNEKLSLSGFYAFQGSDLGEFSAIVLGDPEAEYAVWDYVDNSNRPQQSVYQFPKSWGGGTLPMQPEHKAAATLVYETPVDALGGGSLSLLGTLTYTGERYPFVENVESQKIAAYNRLDLRAAWTSADNQWGVTLYVQNAMDHIALFEYLPQIAAGRGGATGSLTEARQFGLQIRWNPQL
ncbi:MAG: TonB-dependent receptor [Gammaproteobacteria bacterium]|nr:TonB-dependent receptor [Gammaproteobacteria bacterium]